MKSTLEGGTATFVFCDREIDELINLNLIQLYALTKATGK